MPPQNRVADEHESSLDIGAFSRACEAGRKAPQAVISMRLSKAYEFSGDIKIA